MCQKRLVWPGRGLMRSSRVLAKCLVAHEQLSQCPAYRVMIDSPPVQHKEEQASVLCPVGHEEREGVSPKRSTGELSSVCCSTVSGRSRCVLKVLGQKALSMTIKVSTCVVHCCPVRSLCRVTQCPGRISDESFMIASPVGP